MQFQSWRNFAANQKGNETMKNNSDNQPETTVTSETYLAGAIFFAKVFLVPSSYADDGIRFLKLCGNDMAVARRVLGFIAREHRPLNITQFDMQNRIYSLLIRIRNYTCRNHAA